jgi:hypothetical protein
MGDLVLRTHTGYQFLAGEVRIRITYRCAIAGCPNSVSPGRPPRCPVHATDEDVLEQLREPIYRASNFLGWKMRQTTTPWGLA